MEYQSQAFRPQRPGGLTAICVIAIVLGSLGLCFVLFTAGSMALATTIQRMVEEQQRTAMNNPAHDANLEMQKKMQAIGDRHRGSNLALLLANTVLAGSLLAGGIAALRMVPKARTFLLAVFVAAILFVILRAVIEAFGQIEMAAVISDSMRNAMATAVPRGPAAGQATAQATHMATMFAKVGVFLGMAVTVVLALAKVIFYGIGARYLCRPDIRRLFETNRQ
jgi:hypothetical protein